MKYFSSNAAEAKRAKPEQLRGYPRVENAAHVPAVILMQEAKIVVRVVEDDFDVRALEQRAKTGRRRDRNGVDDRGLFARGELEQVDSVDEPMEARTLGIEREDRCAGDRRGETASTLLDVSR